MALQSVQLCHQVGPVLSLCEDNNNQGQCQAWPHDRLVTESEPDGIWDMMANSTHGNTKSRRLSRALRAPAMPDQSQAYSWSLLVESKLRSNGMLCLSPFTSLTEM